MCLREPSEKTGGWKLFFFLSSSPSLSPSPPSPSPPPLPTPPPRRTVNYAEWKLIFQASSHSSSVGRSSWTRCLYHGVGEVIEVRKEQQRAYVLLLIKPFLDAVISWLTRTGVVFWNPFDCRKLGLNGNNFYWRYLTRGLIWHLSQSPTIRPSIYFVRLWNHARIRS